MSQTGVPQGCTVSGWAFCWGINDILQEIDPMLEWQAWYMDGLFVGGHGTAGLRDRGASQTVIESRNRWPGTGTGSEPKI